MTCEPCRTIWARPERLEIYDTGKQHGCLLHDSFSQLQKSVSSGCELCQLLLQHIANVIDEEQNNKHREKILPESSLFRLHIGILTTGAQTNHHSGSSTLFARVDVRSRYGKKSFDLFKHGWDEFFEVVVDRSVAYKSLSGSIFGRVVVEDPTSIAHVDLIKSWVSECSEKHELCRTRLAERCLPSRTIDVGPADGSENPRLVLNIRDESQEIAWIALSHRWGNSIPIKTMSFNLDTHQKEILFDDVPRTFQDAVSTTRRLGLRHLWIDSLCIVQDDPEDWLAEYPKMGSIFEQAHLTLAADNASNCDAGLLGLRVTEDILSFPWNSPDGNTKTWIRIRKGLKAWKYVLGERESSIYTRGWILQEDLLAQRTLHYGRQQVFWECRTHRRSESLSNPFRNFTTLNLTAGKSFMRLASSRSTNNHSRKHPDLLVYAEWAVIVRDYTRRSLTFPSDKLPALVGAAQAFQRRLRSPRNGYYAGLWEDNLHKDLLWRPKFSIPLTLVPNRAPSWSWASVDGPVLFPRHMRPAHDGCLAEFHRSVGIDGEGDKGGGSSDAYWPFTSPRHVASHTHLAALRISAPCIPCARYDVVSSALPAGYSDNGIRLHASSPSPAPSSTVAVVRDDSNNTSSNTTPDLLCYFDTCDAQTLKWKENPDSLVALAIAAFGDSRRGRIAVMGLLLDGASENGGEGDRVYRRVGTTRVDVPWEGGGSATDGHESIRARLELCGWNVRTVMVG
ncbi:HET-domain-containing protein [Pseudovirgaria hyperparasitica]|uniref:HET-domain-containing protein n=1 Tax=Pseudovirgaria hyperparasitica TaxID=470096 RepID=A0A6A6WAJ9_9PEZI|nr:HET-domain-containing protein [Pseudovirgaria hyperparasitica]KAF2758856.1 HET-domain-containing protein [Pseudovirgaria hyperparasitica]